MNAESSNFIDQENSNNIGSLKITVSLIILCFFAIVGGLLYADWSKKAEAEHKEKIQSALSDIYHAADMVEWHQVKADKRDASLADAANYTKALGDLEKSESKAESLGIPDIDIIIARSDGSEAGQKRTKAFWDQYK